MHEAFVNVNGVPTQVMTWGSWIEETLPQKEVIIFITGNPGLPGFYTQFLKTIHSTIDQSIPVWVLAHAGHIEPPKTWRMVLPPLESNGIKYDLSGQIQHKAEFIRKYVPKDVKVHLIGHSIGAYIALELLKDVEINKQIKQCYFLYPTIERMAISENGKFYVNFIRPFIFILHCLLLIFAMFPRIFRTYLIGFYIYLKSLPNFLAGTILKFSDPNVVKKIFYMANDEIDLVIEADVTTLEKNKNRIKMYYGACDGWVPLKYYREIKERIPDLDAEIDTMNIPHTFVLTNSKEIGEMVGEWIKQNKD